MKKLTLLAFMLLPFLTPFRGSAQDDVFVSKEPSGKNVLFEEYTGAHCSNCPRAHKKEAEYLWQYYGRFIAINIHAGGYAAPAQGELDMRTPDGTRLNSDFNIPYYPAVVLNRRQADEGYVTEEKNWDKGVEALLNEDSYVNLAAKGEMDWNTRKLQLRVQEYITREPSVNTLYLHLALIQDGFISRQSGSATWNPEQETEDGKYIHLHVLRDFLTDVNAGQEITGVAKDALLEQEFEFDIPETFNDLEVDFLNLHLVAFVTEGPQKEAVTACRAHLKPVNAPEGVLAKINGVHEMPSLNCTPSARIGIDFLNVMGTEMESATFEITTDAGAAEYTWNFEGKLEEDYGAIVEFEVPLMESNKDIEVFVKLVKVNGEAYTGAEASGTTTVFHSGAVPYTTHIIMDLCQDRYGEDITWTMDKTETGETAYSGGPYGNLDATGTLVHYIHMDLEHACYKLTVNDANNDGINNSFGKGYVRLKSYDGQEFYYNTGKYGSGFYVLVDAREASANEGLRGVVSVSLTPNPARDFAVLRFELASGLEGSGRLELCDESGRVVWMRDGVRMAAGLNEITLPVSSLSSGLYIVKLQGKGVSLTRKLLK